MQTADELTRLRRGPSAGAPIGVIGGTLVDTWLGERFFADRGWTTLAYATSKSPQEQDFLQRFHSRELQSVCASKLREIESAGAELAVIYCSSLSSVLDLAALRSEVRLSVLTPMDFYAGLGTEYSRFAVLAANAPGLEGAAETLAEANPSARIIGAHDLEMVMRIEERREPESVITTTVARFLSEAERHAEVLVLACTHFPYLSTYLRDRLSVPVCDIDSWLAGFLPLAGYAPRAQEVAD